MHSGFICPETETCPSGWEVSLSFEHTQNCTMSKDIPQHYRSWDLKMWLHLKNQGQIVTTVPNTFRIHYGQTQMTRNNLEWMINVERTEALQAHWKASWWLLWSLIFLPSFFPGQARWFSCSDRFDSLFWFFFWVGSSVELLSGSPRSESESGPTPASMGSVGYLPTPINLDFGANVGYGPPAMDLAVGFGPSSMDSAAFVDGPSPTSIDLAASLAEDKPTNDAAETSIQGQFQKLGDGHKFGGLSQSSLWVTPHV